MIVIVLPDCILLILYFFKPEIESKMVKNKTNNKNNRFYSEMAIIGEKRPQYREGLNSKHSKNRWGFKAKEQSGNQWKKNYEEETLGMEGNCG